MTRVFASGQGVRQVTRQVSHTVLTRRPPLGSAPLRLALDLPLLLKPVCLAVLLAAAPSGWALPQAAVVSAGQVALRSPQPGVLEILQSSCQGRAGLA